MEVPLPSTLTARQKELLEELLKDESGASDGATRAEGTGAGIGSGGAGGARPGVEKSRSWAAEAWDRLQAALGSTKGGREKKEGTAV